MSQIIFSWILSVRGISINLDWHWDYMRLLEEKTRFVIKPQINLDQNSCQSHETSMFNIIVVEKKLYTNENFIVTCIVILKLLRFLWTSCPVRTVGSPDNLRNNAYTNFGNFYRPLFRSVLFAPWLNTVCRLFWKSLETILWKVSQRCTQEHLAFI